MPAAPQRRHRAARGDRAFGDQLAAGRRAAAPSCGRPAGCWRRGRSARRRCPYCAGGQRGDLPIAEMRRENMIDRRPAATAAVEVFEPASLDPAAGREHLDLRADAGIRRRRGRDCPTCRGRSRSISAALSSGSAARRLRRARLRDAEARADQRAPARRRAPRPRSSGSRPTPRRRTRRAPRLEAVAPARRRGGRVSATGSAERHRGRPARSAPSSAVDAPPGRCQRDLDIAAPRCRRAAAGRQPHPILGGGDEHARSARAASLPQARRSRRRRNG